MVRIRRIKYNHMEEIMVRIRRNGHSVVLVMLDLSAEYRYNGQNNKESIQLYRRSNCQNNKKSK
jgi:hypothetical protein